MGGVTYIDEEDIRTEIVTTLQVHGLEAFEDAERRAASLLVKRPFFAHERETRLVYVERRADVKHERVQVRVTDLNKFVDEVRFDPRLRGHRDRNPLARIPLFAHLAPTEQATLLETMTRRVVQAQDVVFWIGDPGDALYVIVEGRVAISAPDERGDHLVLDTLGPGGVFGEISLLDGGPRSATVRALTDVTLLGLSRDAFHGFLRTHPDVAIGVLHLMGARQRASTAALRGLKNPNSVIAESTTVWQRVSDVIATVAASQAFTLTHIGWFGSWVLLNVLAASGLLPRVLAFDPYPFGLLTLIVSLEAIFLSIFVLVSQNRQSERDRIRTDLDYQVNVKAHLEIIGIVERLERIERAVTRR